MSQLKHSTASARAYLAMSLSTLFVGLVPKAPGTWGSLLALLIWWAIGPLSLPEGLLLVLLAFILGTVSTHFYEKWFDRHDPKEVVVDELVGMWITLLIIPLTPLTLIAGFLLFRFFDILKPFPINWIDRKMPGALGTMLDDVLAGVFAFVLLQSLYRAGWLV